MGYTTQRRNNQPCLQGFNRREINRRNDDGMRGGEMTRFEIGIHLESGKVKQIDTPPYVTSENALWLLKTAVERLETENALNNTVKEAKNLLIKEEK